MNQVTEEKKESLTKVFAILGFIALIIFAVWLAVQVVRVLPGAFSSLASIAEVVYNYNSKEELEVSTEKTVLNVGEAFTINWTNLSQEGTYTFTYKCTEGVSIDIRTSSGSSTEVACDTPVNLGDVASVEVLVSSEKSRFIDVPYTIAFIPKNETVASKITDAKVTIVNATIPASGVVVIENEEEVKEPVYEVGDTPVVSTPVAPKPTYTAGTPVTVTKYVYITPVSDPKGKIDLQVTYLGVGIIKNGAFVKTTLEADEAGAMQFEVKNIGTKTAEDWSYEAELPANITYKSDDQKALKPNERAVITLGFEGISKSGTDTVSVEVDVKGDVKDSNNDFSQKVTITN